MSVIPGLDRSVANRRGIFAMTAAMASFSLGDVLVKLATARLPPGEIIFARGCIAAAFLFGLALAAGQMSALPRLLNPLSAMRACIEAVITALFVYAIARLSIGDFTAITQAAPLALTALVAITGAETIGWRRWIATSVGFAGVLLVARPGSAGLDWAQIAALAIAILIAARELLTRRLDPGIPSLIVALGTTLATAAAGLIQGMGEAWIPPTSLEWRLLGSAAVAVSMGNLFIIMAFRGSDIAVVSPFRYTVVFFALSLGYLVWGDRPGSLELAGVALIVGAGLYTVHRERVRHSPCLKPEPVKPPRPGA